MCGDMGKKLHIAVQWDIKIAMGQPCTNQLLLNTALPPTHTEDLLKTEQEIPGTPCTLMQILFIRLGEGAIVLPRWFCQCPHLT